MKISLSELLVLIKTTKAHIAKVQQRIAELSNINVPDEDTFNLRTPYRYGELVVELSQRSDYLIYLLELRNFNSLNQMTYLKQVEELKSRLSIIKSINTASVYNTNELFIQTTKERIKRGAKGKVLLPHVLLEWAIKIQQENQNYVKSN